jgi:UDP-N-acetylglucosamine 3-dehydrogenase
MKIAVFGYGDMGRLHLTMYKSIPNAEVAYLFGRDKTKLSQVANSFGIHYTTNPEDIYKNKSIIGVDICVPTTNHYRYIIDSLKAGKHVFCETPISFNLKEAEKMVTTAKENKRMFLVATLMPFVDEVRYVIETVQSEKLGKPRSVYAYRHHKPYDKIDPVIELMTFEIDTVTRLLGVPNQVFAKTETVKNGEHKLATLEYNNAYVVIETSDILSKEIPIIHGLRVICENGIIESTTVFTKPEPEPPQTTIMMYQKGKKKKNIQIETHFPYKEECKYFIDCLNGSQNPDYLNAEKAYLDLKVAIQIKTALSASL